MKNIEYWCLDYELNGDVVKFLYKFKRGKISIHFCFCLQIYLLNIIFNRILSYITKYIPFFVKINLEPILNCTQDTIFLINFI